MEPQQQKPEEPEGPEKMKLERAEPQELMMESPEEVESRNLKKQKMNCDLNEN